MNTLVDSIDEFSGEYRFLSNFAPVQLTFQGDLHFPSVEHAYQALKSNDPSDWVRLQQCRGPGQAKRVGQTLKLRPDWEQKKVTFMGMLLREKFSQRPYQELLIGTGQADLCEGNHWGDTFWGVYRGKGQNILGRLLMKEREFQTIVAKAANEHLVKFVFGSNIAGIHGKGAARFAHTHHGAQMGVGEGPTGSSYALPTCDRSFRALPFETVRHHVDTFKQHAADKIGEQYFRVSQVGCGLAGYRPEQIAPLFQDAPDNCLFDFDWMPFLGPDHLYWGSF